MMVSVEIYFCVRRVDEDVGIRAKPETGAMAV
jgi:hypothetical protein